MEVADYYSPALKKVSTFKNPSLSTAYNWFGTNPNSFSSYWIDLGSHAFASKTDPFLLPAIKTYNLLYSGLIAYKFNNGYILKEDAVVSPYLFAKLQGSWATTPIFKESVNGFGGSNWCWYQLQKLLTM